MNTFVKTIFLQMERIPFIGKSWQNTARESTSLISPYGFEKKL